MTENENQQSDINEVEETDVDENSSDSKLVKEIKKKQKAVKKIQKRVKNEILTKLQIILAVVILIGILMWGTVEKVLHWFSGQTEITVVDKTENNGCFEIITSANESFCVDLSSYNLAKEGTNYLLEEYQYTYILRAVK